MLSNSRGPHTLASLVEELGPRARAATPAEAAAAGDWVVVTVPFHAYRQIPAEALAGKVVLDTGNYYPQRDGQIPELDSDQTTTSELVQRHLPESRVVKVFNNIYFKHLAALARPVGAADRSALPIAGDDPAAKAAVTTLLDILGFDTVDAGPLAEGRRFQRDTPAYATLYAKNPDGTSLTPDDPGSPVTAETLRTTLTSVRHHDDTAGD
ncbi:NADP oxidoreductase [Sphaerisporangium siamense]|nr:NADP oxidoreductase [Sphaerisporangium siamense]